jgi:hypothetical protein
MNINPRKMKNTLGSINYKKWHATLYSNITKNGMQLCIPILQKYAQKLVRNYLTNLGFFLT